MGRAAADTGAVMSHGGTTYCKYSNTQKCSSQVVYNTKGTRAHTHRELIRTWLWEPKGRG